MNKWEDFFPYVMPHVLGCPEPLAEQAIRTAAIEFCKKTLCYTQTMDPITSDGNSTNFDLDLPPKTEVIRLMGVSVNGLGDHAIYSTEKGLQLVRLQNPGYFVFMSNDRTLNVWPEGLGTQTIVVDLALKPTEDSLGIDSVVISGYMRDIGRGAIADLQMLPNRAWSNPNLAAVNQAMFSKSMTTTASVISRGRSASKAPNFKTYL